MKANSITKIFMVHDETFPSVFNRININQLLFAAAQTISQIYFLRNGVNSNNENNEETKIEHKMFALFIGLSLLSFIQQKETAFGIGVHTNTPIVRKRSRHSKKRIVKPTDEHDVSIANKESMKYYQNWIMKNFVAIQKSLNDKGLMPTHESIIANTYYIDTYFSIMNNLCIIKIGIEGSQVGNTDNAIDKLAAARSACHEYVAFFMTELKRANVDYETLMAKRDYSEMFGRHLLCNI